MHSLKQLSVGVDSYHLYRSTQCVQFRSNLLHCLLRRGLQVSIDEVEYRSSQSWFHPSGLYALQSQQRTL